MFERLYVVKLLIHLFFHMGKNLKNSHEKIKGKNKIR